MYGLFRGLGYPPAISSAFAKLSTYKKRLPQGAPSSPTIANIICKRLDSRLLAYCNKNSISYTRYADDLTFSSTVAEYPPTRTIYAIIQSEGFEINIRKERIIRSSCRQIVTGLVVNKKVSVLRIEKKRIRAICFQERCKRSTKPNIFLQGRIAFVGMVEPDSSVVKSYFAYFKKKSMTEDA